MRSAAPFGIKAAALFGVLEDMGLDEWEEMADDAEQENCERVAFAAHSIGLGEGVGRGADAGRDGGGGGGLPPPAGGSWAAVLPEHLDPGEWAEMRGHLGLLL